MESLSFVRYAIVFVYFRLKRSMQRQMLDKLVLMFLPPRYLCSASLTLSCMAFGQLFQHIGGFMHPATADWYPSNILAAAF